jgi:hypothetical protein
LISLNAVPCPFGTYGTSNNECVECKENFVCDEAGLTESRMENEKACPFAVVCPESSGLPKSLDGCPIGTFSESQIDSLENCEVCPAGSFCPEYKLAQNPALGYKCSAGFYCEPGTILDAPFGTQCPPGYYCEIEGMESADEATPCPIGTDRH